MYLLEHFESGLFLQAHAIDFSSADLQGMLSHPCAFKHLGLLQTSLVWAYP
jgi:hypothetical protein